MNNPVKNFVAYLDEKIDIRRFLKFGVTGVLNTLVNLIVYTLCNEVLKADPKLSQVVAYTVATVNSYFINKNWTFNKANKISKTKRNNRSEMFRFVFVNSVSMSFSVLGIYIFHDKLGFNKYLCQIPIAFITTTVNYFGNKILVFRSEHSSKQADYPKLSAPISSVKSASSVSSVSKLGRVQKNEHK